ncbi:hypothetical protein CHLNCDRAFT_144757 [Chlorella variabilis]|uniref:BHLH domain-containing protein n=1 Tax=Chlorella variabilis TaxID=554065 RepID=E1ZCY3_CHLVA|nr:hypothetical protein CHLNCDRAFT_144757 [Chlorella variabilis]EFN56128.1 hypothetical protein CHLNCDRAFT_144757 [Chlorella variabilis]|eukprot:XP_005848230.1 hypothetical protein CHLNCDRAFT_144757 [Chlorella variabilis]
MTKEPRLCTGAASTSPLALDPNALTALQDLLARVPAAAVNMQAASAMPFVSHQQDLEVQQLLQHLQSSARRERDAGAPQLPVPPALPNGGDGGAPPAPSRPAAATSRPGRSAGEARPATSYNARHQQAPSSRSVLFHAMHVQAEARRRSRINERLEALRLLVPHTERANTANFLEEVVQYVQRLQSRVTDLERQLGLPASVAAGQKAIAFADDTPEATTLTAQQDDRRASQSMPEQGPAPPAQPTQALPASTPPAPAPEAQAGVHSVQAVLALLQQASQAPPVPAQEQVQMLLLQAMQAQAVQAQVQQQLDLLQQQQQQQVLPRHQPAAQFSLQFQPPPSLPQQQQQQQQQQQPQAQAFLQGMGSRPLAHSGATSGGGSGSRGDSGARRPYPAALGPQMLAAAESLGTLSAGGGSRRSASRSVVQEEADAAAAEAAKRRGGPGIATDEELDQLHVHLAGQQDDAKRRRLESQ